MAGKPLSSAPAGLRLLADLFDAREAHDPHASDEVQTDLRCWADIIERPCAGLTDAVIDQMLMAPAPRQLRS